MARIRTGYLEAAASAAELLARPEVDDAWLKGSALPELSVGGLAAHLAWQITIIGDVLAAPEPADEPRELYEYYAQVGWIGADLDEPINVRIREGSEREALDGAAVVAHRAAAAAARLRKILLTVEPRRVRLPSWDGWSLDLDDLLLTRLMELVVHADDLAVSVDVPTPQISQTAAGSVVDLLSRLAIRRHGAVEVVRALSRPHRTSGPIAAL
ncbi:MAG TPA: maleylpyruvate isomerase N-terminal domain-containing protein [Kribbella sp.]|uniref:maleylpyruvate isomerase N-terminal domain-containing protein n=1 Tax=Kribbella sp. TaxID=1871183 RepID=UPI002D77C7D0|nr:maleylpyruvate isomerase N-terminal domain-containing protein [Kribbella sp.]HET6292275.1 maleylpyruvate isomerase N-terminal domain-containing protein [Kribbella sp.]